jgi:hypothetical protein
MSDHTFGNDCRVIIYGEHLDGCFGVLDCSTTVPTFLLTHPVDVASKAILLEAGFMVCCAYMLRQLSLTVR